MKWFKKIGIPLLSLGLLASPFYPVHVQKAAAASSVFEFNLSFTDQDKDFGEIGGTLKINVKNEDKNKSKFSKYLVSVGSGEDQYSQEVSASGKDTYNVSIPQNTKLQGGVSFSISFLNAKGEDVYLDWMMYGSQIVDNASGTTFKKGNVNTSKYIINYNDGDYSTSTIKPGLYISKIENEDTNWDEEARKRSLIEYLDKNKKVIKHIGVIDDDGYMPADTIKKGSAVNYIRVTILDGNIASSKPFDVPLVNAPDANLENDATSFIDTDKRSGYVKGTVKWKKPKAENFQTYSILLQNNDGTYKSIGTIPAKKSSEYQLKLANALALPKNEYNNYYSFIVSASDNKQIIIPIGQINIYDQTPVNGRARVLNDNTVSYGLQGNYLNLNIDGLFYGDRIYFADTKDFNKNVSSTTYVPDNNIGFYVSNYKAFYYVKVVNPFGLTSNVYKLKVKELLSAPVQQKQVNIINHTAPERDTIIVKGVKYGETIKVYDKNQKQLISFYSPSDQLKDITLQIAQLGTTKGYVYMTRTEMEKAESEMTKINFTAEKSKALSTKQIKVTNNKNKNDIVSVSGVKKNDSIKVYNSRNVLIGSAKATSSSAVISIKQLGSNAGYIYVTTTSPGLEESNKVSIKFTAEKK